MEEIGTGERSLAWEPIPAEKRKKTDTDQWPIPWGIAEALKILVFVFLVAIAYGSVNNRWYRAIPSVGGSMSPVFEFGDLIIITRPPEGETLPLGTIISFQVKGQICTHRIVGITDEGYITKGDANTVADSWRVTKVAGVYFGRLPYVGYGVKWISNAFTSVYHWLFEGIPKAIGNLFPSTGAMFVDKSVIEVSLRAGYWVPTPTPTSTP